MSLRSELVAILLAPYLGMLRGCDMCGHADSYHDQLGRCHFDDCGCTTFFPKTSIGAAARGESPEAERAKSDDGTPLSSPPYIESPAADSDRNGCTREVAGQQHRAVFLNREGHA